MVVRPADDVVYASSQTGQVWRLADPAAPVLALDLSAETSPVRAGVRAGPPRHRLQPRRWTVVRLLHRPAGAVAPRVVPDAPRRHGRRERHVAGDRRALDRVRAQGRWDELRRPDPVRRARRRRRHQRTRRPELRVVARQHHPHRAPHDGAVVRLPGRQPVPRRPVEAPRAVGQGVPRAVGVLARPDHRDHLDGRRRQPRDGGDRPDDARPEGPQLRVVLHRGHAGEPRGRAARRRAAAVRLPALGRRPGGDRRTGVPGCRDPGPRRCLRVRRHRRQDVRRRRRRSGHAAAAQRARPRHRLRHRPRRRAVRPDPLPGHPEIVPAWRRRVRRRSRTSLRRRDRRASAIASCSRADDLVARRARQEHRGRAERPHRVAEARAGLADDAADDAITGGGRFVGGDDQTTRRPAVARADGDVDADDRRGAGRARRRPVGGARDQPGRARSPARSRPRCGDRQRLARTRPARRARPRRRRWWRACRRWYR